MIYNLANRLPFRNATWKQIFELPASERLAAISDPAKRDDLVSADMAAAADRVWVFPDGDARYDCRPEDSLEAEAARAGVSPVEYFLDRCIASNGTLNLNYPILNESLDSVQEMLDDPMISLGLADAGAHVGQIMDSSQPTFYLTYWVREQGRWPLEEAIRRLTSDTADLFGITNRGRLVEGAHADVNVIDFDNLRLPQPEYVFDFPNGAGRYIQRASGYDYTIVNGQVFMEGGEHSGAFAGTTLRS